MKIATSPLSSYALAVTDSTHPLTGKNLTPWDKDANRFDPKTSVPDEEYGAVVYPDRISLPFALTEESIANEQLDQFCSSLPVAGVAEKEVVFDRHPSNTQNLDVFVCVRDAVSLQQPWAD